MCTMSRVEYMFEETKNYAGGASWKTKGWKAFATQFHDVRFKAKLVFESEFLDVYWRPRNATGSRRHIGSTTHYGRPSISTTNIKLSSSNGIDQKVSGSP